MAGGLTLFKAATASASFLKSSCKNCEFLDETTTEFNSFNVEYVEEKSYSQCYLWKFSDYRVKISQNADCKNYSDIYFYSTLRNR